ncbi:MAG: AbrB family transcriptional regulator, partial [Pseudomonadota bacterium]
MGAELRTALIALVGVGVWGAMGLPLPFLLGPMFACLIAALAGIDLRVRKRLSDSMRTILGVAVGASFTPALLAVLPSMLSSLALVPVLVVAIGLTGYPLFRHGFRFDPATSYYAAMPGGLQDMLIFGEEAGGDLRALSLIHATRVLIIVSLLPLIMTAFLEADLSNAPGLPTSEVPLRELALMVVIAVVG